MEKVIADETDEISKVPSIQAAVHHLHVNINAQNGCNVTVPVVTGSNIGTFDNNLTTQGTVVTSQDNPNNNNTDICRALQPQKCQRKLKATLQRKCSTFLSPEVKKIPLHKNYTELYITEGGGSEVNKEHEVRQIETASSIHVTPEKSIHCSHLFAPLPGREFHVRTVVTRGVAGIGKTVLAIKFTLDWAEETANKNLEFVFLLSFRDLNKMTNKTSLEELLGNFFPEIKDSEIFSNVQQNMLFILDGLDESQFSLDFREIEIMSDVRQPTTISVLLTNLIRGWLLPSALVWITSRPVASSQIPAQHIDLLTEVRGFNDLQKDEYFRRKIQDEHLASQVIAHVKSSRSLHIMCHIPFFCWMTASILEGKLSTHTGDSKDTTKNLTEMNIHFLRLYLENMKRRQPGSRESNTVNVREHLLSLGKLAFQELEKGHWRFYESNLSLNGINVTQESMLSGVYTQVFNEEMIVCPEKMFCFMHLSVQEFFAALYVFLKFHNDNENVLVKRSSASRRFFSRGSSEFILYKEAVEKALKCENGHFDIFLRFLLGLLLESNQALLKNLMTSNRTHQKTRGEVIDHIKEQIRANPSSDRCLNLFHCLNELNDHSLTKEIQAASARPTVTQVTGKKKKK